MVFGWIIGGVVIVGGIWVIATYNRAVRLENQVENGFAQIDVQLKRRADLIPNLVNTVKGYVKHEKEVLENVTKARAAVMDANTTEEKVHANNQLTETLKSLFAVAENYPDLKANENFLALQEELTTTENKIASARQFYNDRVLDFNNLIEVFPNNAILPMFGKRVKEMLQTPEAERETVKVSF